MSQQRPLTLSPPSRRYQRPHPSHSSAANLASTQQAGGSTPPLQQSASPCRVTRQRARAASAQQSAPSQTPPSEEEEEQAEAEETARVEVHADPTEQDAAVCFQKGFGSRLALSLGGLDIPQLLAERDLHQGGLVSISPCNTSEPMAGDHFGGVLGNSLMLNNLGCGGSLPAPKPFLAGDPAIITMMHNLAHWSEKARQEQEQLSQQAQQRSGREAPNLNSSFHQGSLDAQCHSPSMSPQGGGHPSAGFRVPPGSFTVPSPSRGPSITSGAKLDFANGGRCVMSGNCSSRCPDHVLTGLFCCPGLWGLKKRVRRGRKGTSDVLTCLWDVDACATERTDVRWLTWLCYDC